MIALAADMFALAADIFALAADTFALAADMFALAADTFALAAKMFGWAVDHVWFGSWHVWFGSREKLYLEYSGNLLGVRTDNISLCHTPHVEHLKRCVNFKQNIKFIRCGSLLSPFLSQQIVQIGDLIEEKASLWYAPV